MKRGSQDRGDDIEAAAAWWLARRDAGFTPAQEDEFERWKVADPRHAAAWAEFESMWVEVGRPRRTGVGGAVRRECDMLRRGRRRRRASLAAAFAVVLLFVLAVPGWKWPESLPAPSQTVVLLPERRTLPDGSVIELKEGARIAVSFDASGAGPRRVALEAGEAHFQVTPMEDRPFIVSVGEVAVRAVGTAFTIDRGSHRIDVLVTEGRVAVEKNPRDGHQEPPAFEERRREANRAEPAAVDSASEWLLEAGNRMIVPIGTNAAAPELLPVAEAELTARLAWRSPRVEFSRAPLGEVVRVVNRFNRVQFRIADPDLARVTLSGLFRADDAGAFARALERNFGIVVERLSEREMILRRGR